MGRMVAAFLVGMVACAGALIPAPVLAQGPTARDARYRTFGLTYPLTLAAFVRGETMPQNFAPGTAPDFAIIPEYTQLTFVGYPITNSANWEPQVMLFPAPEYATANPPAAKTMELVRMLLDQRPDLRRDEPATPPWLLRGYSPGHRAGVPRRRPGDRHPVRD
jgi:hypothetical protein